jgi:hypothetical protein
MLLAGAGKLNSQLKRLTQAGQERVCGLHSAQLPANSI